MDPESMSEVRTSFLVRVPNPLAIRPRTSAITSSTGAVFKQQIYVYLLHERVTKINNQ